MEMMTVFQILFGLFVMALAIFIIDDLFIDLYSLFHGLGPQNISLYALEAPHEKNIAILIANWREEDVLEQMITGNNKSILYSHHHFLLGVYPNDTATLNIAQRLEQRFSNVHCVINSQEGPTSKGQMHNEIASRIESIEASLGLQFDLFVIHDSEDIIHPLSLKLFNVESERLDFIQIPIFSLNRELRQLVAGTYMDEFSETHTKELLVRNALGAAIPSAGVGTCINRKTMMQIKKINKGFFLRPDSLTEDYILGLQAHISGLRCGFVCKSVVGLSGREHIIATKEYFPSGFQQSIRQKTRWTIGIVFQGWRIIGWTQSWVDNYFLMRDRRGPANSLMTLAALLFLIASFIFDRELQPLYTTPVLALLMINVVGCFVRAIQRVRHHGIVYNSYPFIVILFRWPVSIVINASASARAAYQFYRAQLGYGKLVWSKTQHTLPKEFGQIAREIT